jgi:CS domain
MSVFKSSTKKPSSNGGIYNSELKFVSEKYALFSDGYGNLMVLDTGDRQKSDEWKRVGPILQPLKGIGFILQDTKLMIESGDKIIHCLLLHIEQTEGKFSNIIEWVALKQNSEKTWEETSRRTIGGKGSLYYLSLDPRCTSIVYSSNSEYKYTLDSVNEIVVEPKAVETPVAINTQQDSVNLFKWKQNGEDISINFETSPEVTKDQFKVNCLQSHIEVTCEGKSLVSSDLFAEIDVDLTTWTLEDNFMQVNLVKRDSDLIWPYLIPGGPPMDVDGAQPDLLGNAPVSDLNSQMEECDFGGEDNDEFFIGELIFLMFFSQFFLIYFSIPERLDAVTHKSSHKVFLASNHPIFATTLRPGFPRAIAVRHDVDCCLWLQQTSPSNDEWSLKHEGTLHAFGYIQASKRERKFLACSPDTNLAVVCESSRHLFIYKNSYNTAGGLRKRNGPQLTIGQQKLVSFDGSNGEILGISVENEIILLLTENAICCLQLSIEE